MSIVSHNQVGINGDLDIILICMSHISKVTIVNGSPMVDGGETFHFVKKAPAFMIILRF